MNSRLRFTPPKQTLETTLGEVDLADLVAVRGEYVHAVGAFAAPAGGGPDVAVDVDANAVRTAVAHVAEDAPVGETSCPSDHVEGADGARMTGLVGRPRVHDVEDRVVRRKGEAVGLDQGLVDDGGFERVWDPCR